MTVSSPTSELEVQHDAYGVTGAVCVTLNRPDAFNALSESLLDELQRTLDTLAKSEDARVIVIAASGRFSVTRATPAVPYA